MAVSVQLLQLMYTEKKRNFDNCSWDNIFFHKWHVLIFQETVSVMVYVSLTQSHWRHLLSRKSNERKLVSEVPTLGAMYLGNSVSIVRICCLSVAYVIILNSLNHEKMFVQWRIRKDEQKPSCSSIAFLINQETVLFQLSSLVCLPAFFTFYRYFDLQSWSEYQTESEEEALAKAMELSLMEDKKSSRKAVSTTVEHAVLLPHYFIGQSSLYHLWGCSLHFVKWRKVNCYRKDVPELFT